MTRHWFSGLFLSALIGSCPGASLAPESTDRPAFPGTLPVSFSGTLPCADCAGIRHILEFYPDRTFIHRMSYLGKGGGGSDATSDDLGQWHLASDGRRLTLDGGREGPMMFAVQGRDFLELLDRRGQPIVSTFNHTLTRDATFQAGEPQLQLRGMYAYIADAGVFAECLTGWRLPVAVEADNAALESGYAQARTSPGEPVLVSVEGRIAMRPSIGEGAPLQRALVPIRFERAWPGATCATRIAMNPDADVPSPSTPPLLLDRTRWRLLESQLAAPLPDTVRDRVRFDFSADQFSANSGCNTGSASYRIDPDGTLRLPGAMATTRKACLPDAAAYETAFFAFLTSGPILTSEANGDVLVLRGKAGDSRAQGLLRLRSVAVASAAARQKFIYVSATKAPCTGVAPRECLQVRESPEAPWQLFYGEIIGFSYEPGFEYRLRILEDDTANPPADGSSRRWFLDLVVEQISK